LSRRGRYELRRLVKAAIEDADGEISMDKLVVHLISLGYHGPSIRKVLPILDPNIIFQDGILKIRK